MNLRVNATLAANPQNIENSALGAANSEMRGNAQNVKYKPIPMVTINLI